MKKLLAIALSLCMVAGLAFSLALSTSAAGIPDIVDYVTDGLVAFYTATYHSEDGNTWYDISGNNVNIYLDSYNKEKAYFDDDKGVFVNKATKVYFEKDIADVIATGKFTTEMVIKNTEVTGTTWGTYLNCASDDYSLFIRLGSPVYAEFKCGANWDRPKKEVDNKDAFKNSTVTVTFDREEGIAKIYINGELFTDHANTATLSVVDFFFGNDDVQKSHNTEYAGFRFYDRALTAEEIADNYAADQAGGPQPGGDISEDTSAETSEPAAPAYGENLAKGKTYTVTGNTPRGDDWDDVNGTKLTDGEKDREVTTNTKVAGMKSNNLSVVVDLGEVKDIAGFYADAYGNSAWGIQDPSLMTVEFFYSADGENYTSAGQVKGEDLEPAFTKGDWKIYEFVKAASVQGRYIKVVYTQPGSETTHLWISEIEVYAPAQPGESSETSGTTPTGDPGFIGLSILAVIALAGVVVIKRK